MIVTYEVPGGEGYGTSGEDERGMEMMALHEWLTSRGVVVNDPTDGGERPRIICVQDADTHRYLVESLTADQAPWLSQPEPDPQDVDEPVESQFQRAALVVEVEIDTMAADSTTLARQWNDLVLALPEATGITEMQGHMAIKGDALKVLEVFYPPLTPEQKAPECQSGCTMPLIDFTTGDDRISTCGQIGHGSRRCAMQDFHDKRQDERDG